MTLSGPQKGYTEAKNAYLHQLEGLIGALITSKDKALQSILEILFEDNIAGGIIDRIHETLSGNQGELPGPDRNVKKKSQVSLLESTAFATAERRLHCIISFTTRYIELTHRFRSQPDSQGLAGPYRRINSGSATRHLTTFQAIADL